MFLSYDSMFENKPWVPKGSNFREEKAWVVHNMPATTRGETLILKSEEENVLTKESLLEVRRFHYQREDILTKSPFLQLLRIHQRLVNVVTPEGFDWHDVCVR